MIILLEILEKYIMKSKILKIIIKQKEIMQINHMINILKKNIKNKN